MDNSELLKKKLERERLARKQAERILENKALELYSANEQLKKLNTRKDRVLEAVSKSLSFLFKEDNINVAFRKATKIMGDAGIADRMNIVLLHSTDEGLELGNLYSFSSEQTDSLKVQLSESSVAKQFIEFIENEVTGSRILNLAADSDTTNAFNELANELGIMSSLIIPVYIHESIKAVITFEYFSKAYEWSKSDESILLAFAAAIQSAIERYDSRAALDYQRQFYENILNSIPSDLVVFNDKHQYLFINPVAVRDQETREWMIGKDDYQYVEYRNKPIEIADNRRKAFNHVVEEKEALSFEEKFVNKDGETEWKLRTLYPVVKDNSQEVDMVIGYGIDITNIKESQELLIKAREEAEASKNMKQKFLANMSHEIRTPMNGVVGIVHLLERTPLDLDQKKYLDILKDSSEHLLHIINDILDVSKIEEGKIVLAQTPVQLDTIIEGVVQNLKSRIVDKNLDLEVDGLDIFTSHLSTDPVRIRQILLNLISNAIKFTHKGKISIKCSTIQESEHEHAFKIEVRDTGIGISKERIKTIFQAFDQANKEISSQYGGTGLGLNIVKELVHKMNGSIVVESELNKGSNFIVTLSLEKTENVESPFSDSDQILFNENSLDGKTILIADDHEINFIVASETIEVLGANVIYAEDGEIAVSKVIDQDIDLILMDMQMPNVDGIEATKMIRLLGGDKSKIPIIAMTAAALPEEREKCLQSGMNDYISKPYNPNMLFQVLSNYLIDGDSSAPANQEKDSSSSEEKRNSNELFDLSYLKDLSGNNTKFIMDMITSFKNDMPEMIDEMLIQADGDNPKEIGKISHKASSLAGYLGCDELRNILRDIESKSDGGYKASDLKELVKEAAQQTKEIDKQLNEVEL